MVFTARHFTLSIALLQKPPQEVGRRGSIYLDVPAERISELRPSRELPATVFVVPPALSALRKPVAGIEESVRFALPASQ